MKTATKAPEEVLSLFGELDIVHDLYDKYNINYNHNTYEYDEICPLVRKKFEKEIEKYKNNLVKFLNLIITDDYKLRNYEIAEYSLKSIVCDFSRCIYGRCDEVEELVVKSAILAAYYIDDVIKARWEKFEKNIPKYPDDEKTAKEIYEYCKSYNYTSESVENKIKKFPDVAYYYAIGVKKERWIDGEHSILKNIERATEYVVHLGFRWPEYENKIRNKPKRILEYAKQVIKGKLPEELHNRMLMKSISGDKNYEATAYFDWLRETESAIVSYMKSISPEEREILLKKV